MNIDPKNPLTIEISGDEPIVIDKVYGPQIFTDIRVTADIKTNQWVIERQLIKTMAWIEWCRIPGQLDQDLTISIAPNVLKEIRDLTPNR